jgi:hypothetical protein
MNQNNLKQNIQLQSQHSQQMKQDETFDNNISDFIK